MLNQVLKVSSGTCQQFVEDAVEISNIFGFSTSQSSVATYCRCGGNLCGVYIDNFSTNQFVKKFWKSVHICRKSMVSQNVRFLLGYPVLFWWFWWA